MNQVEKKKIFDALYSDWTSYLYDKNGFAELSNLKDEDESFAECLETSMCDCWQMTMSCVEIGETTAYGLANEIGLTDSEGYKLTKMVCDLIIFGMNN